MRLMLEPGLARALHLSSLKPHGMRNFVGSPSFSASFGSVKVSFARSSSSGLMNGGDIGTEGPLRTRPLWVVMALNSPFGLAMVLLGNGPEPEVEAVFI
nr:hypothetical protein [Tanacetum cinerariifolium]